MQTKWIKCMAAGLLLQLSRESFALDFAKYYGGSYDGYEKRTSSPSLLSISLDATKYCGDSYEGYDLSTSTSYILQDCNFTDTETAILGVELFFNEGGDGHGVAMNFISLTGSGNVSVEQINQSPSNAPCSNVCDLYWNISDDGGISSFSANVTFHYTNIDVYGYTESEAFLGIAKFNALTNTWIWLGGTVDGGTNTVTVPGVTSFSTFALFRRIFGDCTGDGYVDAADLQRLGDCWHEINSGEFSVGTDARFFNYNKNTEAGDQIIDAADLQVFGDCWHNGIEP